MNLPGLLHQSGQSLAEFWAARDTRERALLAVAAITVALGLYYALLVAPALTGRGQLHKNLPELRQQAAQLQALAQEAAIFSGKSAPVVAAVSEESIRTALAHQGLQPQSVTLSGELAKVQLTAVSFSGMLEWLDDMQKTAKLSVADANIVALPQPDRVNAVLTLRRSGNE
ncbi:MAG: type II secretion system protein M [Gallionella sp.]|nr:type II secretion system protein M [Gallionella sp.]